MLGFSPYQVRALIDYLYVNEVVLSIAKIKFNMRYSIEDRITQEKIISYENPVDLINHIINKENNVSL